MSLQIYKKKQTTKNKFNTNIIQEFMTAVGGESLFLQSDWVQMTMTKDIGLMLVLERRTDTFSLLIKKNGEPKNTLTLKKGGTKNIHKTCTMN